MILTFLPFGFNFAASSIDKASHPAARIFSLAESEKLNAAIFNFLSSSPKDRTFPGTITSSPSFENLLIL